MKFNELSLKMVEDSYQEELDKYSPHKNIKGINVCAILMARELLKKGKIWWYSWEAIGRHYELFGSHKTPARFSDLVKYYPKFFESRKVGKYTVYRIKIENINEEQLLAMQNISFDIKKQLN